MKARVLAPVAGAFLLAACGFTPEGQLFRRTARTAGAQAMDAGLSNAEWYICQAASIGAVRRHYGKPGLAEAYRALCDDVGANLIDAEQ